MGSEADVEATATNAVDSDGSVSWEDFFGSTTDLVPQLLGMFDDLARRGNGNGYSDHVVLSSTCNIPAALQKRLSLVSHRGSIFGQFHPELSKTSHEDTMEEHAAPEDTVDIVVAVDVTPEKESDVYRTVENGQQEDRNECAIEKKPYRRESNGLTPLRYSRRCSNGGRPLSGSSVESSSSSSGCSNQGNACTINPYLASVESLADTCASSQGSGDSGVVTVSESNCQIGNDRSGQRRNSAEEDLLFFRPRYCDPDKNPVERVLLEIVDTEAIYVEHLRQVIEGYLIFWRNDPASFVHQMQLSDLFSNIEDIYEFNREFLKEIEKCNLDPVCVANTFIKHNSGFKVYTEYCTNYPRTDAVLTELMRQEETAQAFRERQAALHHALPLGSFLLKPVQRILKYHLLLENLSKEYGAECEQRENETEGRKAIEEALAAMTGIAKHINAMKRRCEHAVRVQEIQSLLYDWTGPDITSSGELVAEGKFRMRGAKAPRHAFLFDRMLLLTKKKEDGLLVYKTHILCSNLMLIESIPGEPLSFHVIPFDNPRLQYTLQARNLEQKREWTLQIKRVILENYKAAIPLHARQLVLQLGQTQPDDDALADRGMMKKQHSAPPEYLEKRKQEKERRRSETGIRQKFKRSGRKSETTIEDSPASPRKNRNDDSTSNESREQGFKVSDGRGSKVKDRFTGWRRKSEPGFQSYVSLNQSDEEQKADTCDTGSATIETERAIIENDKHANPSSTETKENNEQQTQAQTVEEIVGHILMQNQEFQKLLEKQRTNSTINVRQQQRFNKHISADTSDDSDSENIIYATDNSMNNRISRVRTSHRERSVKTNNTWNALSSSRDHQPTLQLLYDNLNKTENNKSAESNSKNKANHAQEKKAVFEAFKRQSIVTESKVIKTALRIRENSSSRNEEVIGQSPVTKETEIQVAEANQKVPTVNGFGNYDNLQHVWEGLREEKDLDGNDSPTRPSVWLTKRCEGLPTSPQKCGSLPRSFQIHHNSNQNVTKSRFLQRDGKPMSERPFTIASDKPAEINLEDMERYASTCQPEGRIAKFPTSVSTSTSTFFCSLDDTLTDAYSEMHMSSTTTNIHPDHKIYRTNTSGSALFKNVLSKAGNRLQGLRNTMSTETLECSEELERTKYFRSLSTGKLRKKGKMKHSRESSSDVEELVGCTARGSSNLRIPSLYYKQGSSSLGARIAQSDYADPTVLFFDSKRRQQTNNQPQESKQEVEEEEEKEDEESVENRESETDSFYEKSFEMIENYVDTDVDDAFRDSAIFSDIEEILVAKSLSSQPSEDYAPLKSKVAPPVPLKKRIESFTTGNSGHNVAAPRCKPSVAQKPDYLKVKTVFLKGQQELDSKVTGKTPVPECGAYQCLKSSSRDSCVQNSGEEKDDVSAGQSQAGWVRKIVGQLQGHVET
ncbi:guanine nucleotide exchange factor in mesoderm isoform X2 [Xylocopa sonorina]|uniref:guanine nucleotide exchange factor in mesoderm isoform X2 n=1 Tax=Xylocopa sonorina TaxID=1818115 RepID=UPI00403AE0F8